MAPHGEDCDSSAARSEDSVDAFSAATASSSASTALVQGQPSVAECAVDVKVEPPALQTEHPHFTDSQTFQAELHQFIADRSHVMGETPPQLETKLKVPEALQPAQKQQLTSEARRVPAAILDVLRGEWETSRVGIADVTGDAVSICKASQNLPPMRLMRAGGDGCVALDVWRTEVPKSNPCNVLFWRNINDATGEDTIVWVRLRVLPSDPSSALVVQSSLLGHPSAIELCPIQGRWETTRHGAVSVEGSMVKWKSTAAVLRRDADGRLSIDVWRAEVIRGSSSSPRSLRWTRVNDPSGEDMIVWVRPVGAVAEAEAAAADFLQASNKVSAEVAASKSSVEVLAKPQAAVESETCNRIPRKTAQRSFNPRTPLSPARLRPRREKAPKPAPQVLLAVEKSKRRGAAGQRRPLEKASVSRMPATVAAAPIHLNNDWTCKKGHPLQPLIASSTPCAQFQCDVCGTQQRPSSNMLASWLTCERCEFDVCSYCSAKGPSAQELLMRQINEKRAELMRLDSLAAELQRPRKQAKRAIQPQEEPQRNGKGAPKKKRQTSSELMPQSHEIRAQARRRKEVQPPMARLSGEAKANLQGKLDLLDDTQLDLVLDFLEPELGNSSGDEIQLDLDVLSASRQHALVKFVDGILSRALKGTERRGVKSADFPLAPPSPKTCPLSSLPIESMLGKTAEVLQMMDTGRHKPLTH